MNREPFIGVTGPAISGYFAIMFTWSNDINGFEPYTTGMGRYATKAEAVAEGRLWAEAEELEFIE